MRAGHLRRPRDLLFSLLLPLLLGSCDAADEAMNRPPPRIGVTVEIVTFEFVPTRAEVTAGGSVTWLNQDQAGHAVASGTPGDPDGSFRGDLDDEGASFVHTFSAPGTFPYFCSIHPAMTGEIAVGA